MRNALRTHVAAALLLLPVSAAFLAPAAVAQQRVQPAVYEAALNASAGLSPGSTLWLRVTATPTARNVSVTLGQSGVRVALREQSPGAYTGNYTVRTTDRIDPRQLLVIRVDLNGEVVTRNFTYPPAFQALAMTPPPAVGNVGNVPNVAVAPVIERFEVKPGGRLVPGRVLEFTLKGQPKANASLEIPGVIRDLDLKETRPGVYRGSYTIRRADDLRAFDSAVATLRRGPLRTTAKLELRGDEDRRGDRDNRGDRDQRADRDVIPPVISQVTPAEGERVGERQRTRISAKLSDAGSGIDTASVRLNVDGLDVTKNARISPEGVRYREELGSGRHNAELVVRDRAGNTARTTWSFQVQ
ncbi:MAG: hypothetical protein ACO1PB_12250 [Ramlibacter sp.]